MGRITYRIFPEHDLLVTRWTGDVDDDDMVGVYTDVQNDPIWRPWFDEVLDAREARARGVTREGLRRIVELAEGAHSGGEHTIRSAILTARDLEFGLARMYQGLASDSPDQARVFRDPDEALAWLGAPATVLDWTEPA